MLMGEAEKLSYVLKRQLLKGGKIDLGYRLRGGMDKSLLSSSAETTPEENY